MKIVDVAFYKQKKRLFNILTAWWTQGDYSHCEFIEKYNDDGTAVCWSSSFMDGGIRRKEMFLNPEHWDVIPIELTEESYLAAVRWFKDREGAKYDVAGLIGFIWRSKKHDSYKWFCSEAVADATGIKEAWRFDPNSLAAVFRSMVFF